MRTLLLAPLMRFLGKLSYPRLFMVAAAQVGPHKPERLCYGRSMVVDPWGVVLAQAGDTPTVITATLEMEAISRVRGQVPSLKNRVPAAYRGDDV